MSTKPATPTNRSNSALFEEEGDIAVRKFDRATAEAELRLRKEELDRTLADLDRAQAVRPETLRLRFSI